MHVVARTVSILRSVLEDARSSVRNLLRRPGFATVAVLALALGIAANTAMFSVVYAVLLAPLPYPAPEELVTVWPSSGDGRRSIFTPPEFLELKRAARSFQQLHAWTGRDVSLGIGEEAEAVQAMAATPGYLSMMGGGLALGRDFLPEEGTVGRERVAVLSHRFWQERFGGDPAVLGRIVRVDREPYTIVGVQAPAGPRAFQPPLLLPLAFTEEQLQSRFFFFALATGRLKAGVTPAQATAEATAVWARLHAGNPSGSGPALEVDPLQTSFLAAERIKALWLLMGAVGCVLLIACANVANLLLARGVDRRREVALRSSLGASPLRIGGQFLVESSVLAAIGGGLGVLLSFGLIRVIGAVLTDFGLPASEFRLSLPVLAFTVAATVLSALVFGVVPAWQAMRTDPIGALKDGGYATLGTRRSRWRRALVAGEVALALTLLAAGGLVLRDLATLARVDLGLRHDRLLTFRLSGPTGGGSDPERIGGFYREVVARVVPLPGVETVGLSSWLPLQGTMYGRSFDVLGHPDPQARGASFNMVTPAYYEAYGIRTVSGRALSAEDREGAPLVAMVNETFVRRYLAGLDPLAQRLIVDEIRPGTGGPGQVPRRELQIVGVYRDARHGGPKGETQPSIDVPFAQWPWPEAWIAVRTTGDPEAFVASIGAVLRTVEPDLVMRDVKTMRQRVEATLGSERRNAALFGSFAALALLLAAMGVYGVTAFSVAQRTREIGLRMALGADRGRVLRAVIGEGMATVLGGAAAGGFGAYAATRAMRSLVQGVGNVGITPSAVIVALLLAAAFAACIVPARRAASVDPLTALREE